MKRLLTTFAIISLCFFSAAAQVQQTFVHPWHGKKIAYFGDSITDPRVKAGNQKWWTLLSEWLEATSYCYAISGRQWNDIPRQADALLKEHGQDVDAILIFMGTNDYNNCIPLGEWYDYNEEDVNYARNKQKYTVRQKHRTPCMTDSTYRGRINIAVTKLRQLFPTKQIVVLTPIHRAFFASSEYNVQPDESYPNRNGIFLDSYIEATKEIANVWAMPVIDLNALSGLYPLADEHAQYFSRPTADRLHPNDAGYQRIARTLYYQLATLPCTF